MYVGSIQIISRLDSQIKFQMFTLFSGCHAVGRLSSLSKEAPHLIGSLNLCETIRQISEVWENPQTQNLEKCLR